MPPKKNEASKKSVNKEKQKTIEDKTFGLKNKKGSKQQKFIQQVEKQVQHGNRSAKDLEKMEKERMEKKLEKKKELMELNELFKPVMEMQKIAAGVDPKSVLCAYFKQGQCLKKGDKCKFSHDLNIERKAEKRGVFDEEHKDDMNSWDMEKLEDVVAKKHGGASAPNATAIICKFFLDALENSKYGWFWECPNGGNCKYRHALPPGFVLKKDQKKLEEQKETIPLEDVIERDRQALGLNQTKVTLKTFMEWKRRKRLEKAASQSKAKAKRESDFKQGRTTGISGREVFEFNPDLVADTADADEEGGAVYSGDREQTEEEYLGPLRDIDMNTFVLSDTENDDPANPPNEHQPDNPQQQPTCSHSNPQETNQLDVDEDLFDEADLDDLEDEIAELEIEG